jgi:porin
LLDATAEFAGNTGGVKQGATSANQIAFEADIDWQRLAGITGLSTHVIMVNRSGGNDSHLFGDNVSQAAGSTSRTTSPVRRSTATT